MQIMGLSLRRELGLGLAIWDSRFKMVVNNGVLMYNGDFLNQILALADHIDAIVMNDVRLFGSTEQSKAYGDLLSVLVPKYNVYSISVGEIRKVFVITYADATLSPAEGDAYKLTQYYWRYVYNAKQLAHAQSARRKRSK